MEQELASTLPWESHRGEVDDGGDAEGDNLGVELAQQFHRRSCPSQDVAVVAAPELQREQVQGSV